MRYYLIEMNDYEQSIITEKQLRKIERSKVEYNGFTGVTVLREATEKEYKDSVCDVFLKELSHLPKSEYKYENGRWSWNIPKNIEKND